MFTDQLHELHLMHQVMLSMNNECAYYHHWIYEFPDCPNDDDFEYVVTEPGAFESAKTVFESTLKLYAKDGLYNATEEAYNYAKQFVPSIENIISEE